MPVPAEVTISMSQHIGAPCKPVVKVGDTVKVGQLIGDSEAAVSAPIHSSVSGKVKAIERSSMPAAPNRKPLSSPPMASRPSMRPSPPAIGAELEDVLVAARACGLMGLGGAGFPTSVKLAGLKSAAIDTLCHQWRRVRTPHLRLPHHAGKDRPAAGGRGAHSAPYAGRPAVIGIENNKPKAIEKIKADAAAKGSKLEVLELKSRYPQGAEKVIVYEATGRVIPEGKLPSDVGVLVKNVGTVIKLAEYVNTGLPLTSRMVGGWRRGSRAEECLGSHRHQAGGTSSISAAATKGEPAEIILGGPMMGTSCRDDQTPHQQDQ